MRKYVVLLCVLAGCGGGSASQGGGPAAGAVGPRQAVDAFLAAVEAKDLQAMSVVWGAEDGMVRDHKPRDQVEKRELLMQCYLKHDSAKIVDQSPGQDGHVIFKVELTQGQRRRTTNFTTVKGPADRWYVFDIDLSVMQDFCNNSAK